MLLNAQNGSADFWKIAFLKVENRRVDFGRRAVFIVKKGGLEFGTSGVFFLRTAKVRQDFCYKCALPKLVRVCGLPGRGQKCEIRQVKIGMNALSLADQDNFFNWRSGKPENCRFHGPKV